MIHRFKRGSGIHIKKENKGKFTDYCGGKVTQECISKGKNSSNPVIRKRATFAANVRKWKHEKGGQIKKYQLAGTITMEDRLNKWRKEIDREILTNNNYSIPSDNTQVVVNPATRSILPKIKRKLRPSRRATALFVQGLNLSPELQKEKDYQDSLRTQAILNEENFDNGVRVLSSLGALTLPSTYVGFTMGNYNEPGTGNTAVDLGIDLLSPIIASKTLKAGKFLWNNGKIFLKEFPVTPGNYYRQIGNHAMADAIESGVIRAKGKVDYEGPFFMLGTKEHPLYWSNRKNFNNVIEGTPQATEWIHAFPYENYMEALKDPKTLARDLEIYPDLGNYIRKIGNAKGNYEAFPYYNGSVKELPINSEFSYWRKYPIIGWRHFSFKDGGLLKKLQEGGWFSNAANSVWDFIKDNGSTIASSINKVKSGISKNEELDSKIEAIKENIKVKKERLFDSNYNKAFLQLSNLKFNGINNSPIAVSNQAYNMASLMEDYDDYEDLLKILELESLRSNPYEGIFDILTGIIPNKSNKLTTNPEQTTSYENPKTSPLLYSDLNLKSSLTDWNSYTIQNNNVNSSEFFSKSPQIQKWKAGLNIT